jgi:uncharacterized protein YjbJ (UPF0337 family)
MTWDRSTGKWHQLKGRAQAEWARFKDQTLDHIKGDPKQCVGLIQYAYARTEKEDGQEIDHWLRKVS